MNLEELRKECIKIIQERNTKAEVIIAEAKKKGIWKKGLDSNKSIFKEIDEETKRKLDALSLLINKN